jgi:hypothetical protein
VHYFEYKLIPLVMLQSDPILEGQAPVASDANLFDILKGNRMMTVINSELVPIMIATEGTDFNDKNNTEKAANHIANIIATKELGGFTTDTLPRALRGRKVKLTNFTTKVLGNIGVHHFLLFYSDFLILNVESTTCLIQSGTHSSGSSSSSTSRSSPTLRVPHRRLHRSKYKNVSSATNPVKKPTPQPPPPRAEAGGGAGGGDGD